MKNLTLSVWSPLYISLCASCPIKNGVVSLYHVTGNLQQKTKPAIEKPSFRHNKSNFSISNKSFRMISGIFDLTKVALEL